MKRSILIFTTTFLILGFSSCKKDENKINEKSNCSITSVTFDQEDNYELTYDGDLLIKFTEVDGDDEDKLYYNSDNLLTLRNYYTNDKLTNVDTFSYDASKRLTSVTWYSINNSNKRVFEEKTSFEYNSSNQIISFKDSINDDGYKQVDIHEISYQNNRRSKETFIRYTNNEIREKQVISYSYTNIANSLYDKSGQSYLVINSHPLYIADFENTDLLISQLDIKDFDETNTQTNEYSIKFDYTFENGNVKTVSMDKEEFIKFNYKCE
ncbi:MAG TPA: hypothetical protein VLZ75_03540 [Chitinophagales bacterium]|nr:hypothetical protein [Chitinophagales bacterium]